MRARWLAALVLQGAAATAAAAQDTTAFRWTQVSYVSGGQFYVSAGRGAGLAESQELEVVRADSVVAVLRVRFLSSSGAACDLVRGATDVGPGDRVRFRPAATPAPRDTAPAPRPILVRSRSREGGLHGRVGIRYFASRTAPDAGQYTQPAMDVRLAGSRLLGTPLGLVADVRARSSRSEFVAGGTTQHSETDVYQLAVLWQAPGARVRAALGRQYVAGVSSVLLLDGALVEFSGRRAGVGVFGGLEPAALEFDASVQDYGAFVRLHGSPGAGASRSFWSLTAGAVGSYRGGEANREFGFLQASYSSPGLTLRGAQEVDLYRGVRLAAGEQPVSFTSSYVSASYHPAGAFNVDAGFDNRRSVRLYRDATDPLTTFDDGYRQGAWGAVGLAGRHARVRAEGRTNGGVGSGRSTAVTGTVGLERMGRAAVGVWLRSTRYASGELTGWLHALRLAGDPAPPLHLEVSGGVRRETNPPVSLGTRQVVWYGAEADFGIGRAWYLVVSANRETGPEGRLDQAYLSLSYRF
ncbi:MAG TPA: hypothetical protein VD707_05530 [Gemmatimonadales bacterium]|nr:hypothetical protein [Gemmatimonadales bacterium]